MVFNWQESKDSDSEKAYKIFFNKIHQSVYTPLSKNLFKELNKLQFYIYKFFNIFNVI